MNKKLTTEEFITKSKEVHGESKYDYSECVYINANTKTKLRCTVHDHCFEVKPSIHIHQKTGCAKCSGNYTPTTDEFIAQSKEMHGELKYDYSECVYKNSSTKVKLRCIVHDYTFLVPPVDHIHKRTGCTKCTNKYTPSTDEFIAKSKELHGESKYDYSKCEYGKNNKSKINLRCVVHDHWFMVSPNDHLCHRVGCTKCTANYILTTEEFIAKSKEVHGELKYDYSECCYTTARAKVKLRCALHDHWFRITPADHIHLGVGCTKCTGNYTPSSEEFITKSKEIHGESKYDYSECVYKNSSTKVKLRCTEHNHLFAVLPTAHIYQAHGCTQCVVTGYSKTQIKYFDYITQCNSINIQHAGNIGEFKIPGIGKVDGYCCETNTVYEFHGDYWHGHPSKFNPINTHPVTKKTYGALYEKTLARDQKISDLGYNLVVIWEHEWDKIENKNKKLIKI